MRCVDRPLLCTLNYCCRIHVTERDYPADARGRSGRGQLMKNVRIRVIVTLASSAVLASGLSVAAAAVSSGTSAAVSSGTSAALTVASSGSSGTTPTPNITVVDP
jgi:hypothetical protein